ncbi:mitochondrial substrate carrier family protein ucpb-like [Stylonychia lemnae]|uniref:Mitochondrial substrate carrier family protein ucpb-like n=1 Tax=Stylonychia lemnae TaxID=5949 RepID=A0A078B6N3_STYLE|nr:mitochondrial substrate carrier family protein ucpb-like [Stylonychia lemnae]|eukprot:CDW90200.1 mitochondrial substrate carrier family protein ucpb-like [Stylonychia lemnae]
MNLNKSQISQFTCTNPASIQEDLIDLYLTVKVRKNEDIENCSDQQLEREKQKLRTMDLSVIISYIKSSIEILNSLKAHSSQSDGCSQSKLLSILENDINESQEHSVDVKEYEQIIQKLERDVREHIKIQHQMKLHIESIQNKLEEAEKQKGDHKKCIEQIEKLKKDNKRMDELLTMREDKISKLEDQNDKLQKKLNTNDDGQQKVKFYEEKIKQLEKQHQKEQLRLQTEIMHLKKLQSSISSSYHIHTQDSNHFSNLDGGLVPSGSITTTTTCSSNQQIEKPQATQKNNTGMVHRNSQPQVQHISNNNQDQQRNNYKDLQSTREFDNFIYSMDNRENIHPNVLQNGHTQNFSKSIDKSSNSKVIMAKQMLFETMDRTNLPRQTNQNFFNNTNGSQSQLNMQMNQMPQNMMNAQNLNQPQVMNQSSNNKTIESLMGRKSSLANISGQNIQNILQTHEDQSQQQQYQRPQSFIGDYSNQRSARGINNNGNNANSTNDLNKLREKLTQIQGEFKNTQKIAIKRKSSRNDNRDPGIDMDELEAETARIHKEIVSERCGDQDRQKEKRTVSDNTRLATEQQKMMVMPSNNGIKVLLDKSQVNTGNAFAIKRPSAQMMTDRSHHAPANMTANEQEQNNNGQSNTSRRHYNMGQGTQISNYKIVKKKPGSSVNGTSGTSHLNQTSMIRGRDSSVNGHDGANVSMLNITSNNINGSSNYAKMSSKQQQMNQMHQQYQMTAQNNPNQVQKSVAQESDVIRTFFAGIASVTAASVTHPIDTVKIRLQIQGEIGKKGASNKQYNNVFRGMYMIVQEESIRGLYKGITASWMRESIYSSLRLGLYEPFKRLLGATDNKNTPFYLKFLAGGMSGFIGAALANPTDLLKVRMQAWEGKPHGLIWHFNDVYANGGFWGFYRGVTPTVIRAILLNATKLATYDHIKHSLINYNILSDGYMCHFVSSVCAGVCIAVVTSPVDIVKTRIMNQGKEKVYSGMIDCIQKIFKQEGPMAFYKGFTPQWMRFGPFTIVQLMVWEKLRDFYGMKGI